MTDAEASAAVEALTRSIRDRDQAIRDGEEHADPEVFASECVTAMRGFGWRPTAARPYTAPKPVPAPPGGGKREELLGPVRAHLAELNEARRSERETWQDGAA